MDFHLAMAGDASKQFYSEFLADLKKQHVGGETRVKDGVFGAMMQVNIVNDGPVTIELEAPPSEAPPSSSENKSKKSNAKQTHSADNQTNIDEKS